MERKESAKLYKKDSDEDEAVDSRLTKVTRSSIYPPLIMAVRRGDVVKIKGMVSAGADVNVGFFGDTPLTRAVENDNVAALKVLVEAGADVNQQGKYGDTPLMRAVEKNNLAALRVLIEAGADTNQHSWHGRTPLMRAVGKNNKAAIKVLVKAGADIHQQNKYGKTALDYVKGKGTDKGKRMVSLLSGDKEHKLSDTVLQKIPEIKALVPKLETDRLSSKDGNLHEANMDKTKQTEMSKDSTESSGVVQKKEYDRNKTYAFKLKFEHGLFNMDKADIKVLIPRDTDCELDAICIRTQPVSEDDGLCDQNVLSNLITMQPHGLRFQKHMLVRFPIHSDKIKDLHSVQLLYRETDNKESAWINVSPVSHCVNQIAPMFFLLHGGFCYLYTRHFSCVVLVQNDDGTKQKELNLCVSLRARIFPGEHLSMKIIAGIHCLKCQPNQLDDNLHGFGALLGFHEKCFYQGNGDVQMTFEMKSLHWKTAFPTWVFKEKDLFGVCRRPRMYFKMVPFNSDRGSNEDRIEMEVDVSQNNDHDVIKIDTYLDQMNAPVKAQQMRDATVMTDVQIPTLKAVKQLSKEAESLLFIEAKEPSIDTEQHVPLNSEQQQVKSKLSGEDEAQSLDDTANRNRLNSYTVNCAVPPNESAQENSSEWKTFKSYQTNNIKINNCVMVPSEDTDTLCQERTDTGDFFHPTLAAEEKKLCDAIDKECKDGNMNLTGLLPGANGTVGNAENLLQALAVQWSEGQNNDSVIQLMGSNIQLIYQQIQTQHQQLTMGQQELQKQMVQGIGAISKMQTQHQQLTMGQQELQKQMDYGIGAICKVSDQVVLGGKAIQEDIVSAKIDLKRKVDWEVGSIATDSMNYKHPIIHHHHHILEQHIDISSGFIHGLIAENLLKYGDGEIISKDHDDLGKRKRLLYLVDQNIMEENSDMSTFIDLLCDFPSTRPLGEELNRYQQCEQAINSMLDKICQD